MDVHDPLDGRPLPTVDPDRDASPGLQKRGEPEEGPARIGGMIEHSDRVDVIELTRGKGRPEQVAPHDGDPGKSSVSSRAAWTARLRSIPAARSGPIRPRSGDIDPFRSRRRARSFRPDPSARVRSDSERWPGPPPAGGSEIGSTAGRRRSWCESGQASQRRNDKERKVWHQLRLLESSNTRGGPPDPLVRLP